MFKRRLSPIVIPRGRRTDKKSETSHGEKRQLRAVWGSINWFQRESLKHSTVLGCDVTTVQQRYTGSTSTPPPVATLCQIRETSLRALRKFQKSTHAHMCRSFNSSNPSYLYPEISTVMRRHPCQALISICGISRVSVLSSDHLDSHRS